MTSYFVHFDQPFKGIPYDDTNRHGYLIDDHQLQVLTMCGFNYEHRATQTEGLLEIIGRNRLQKRLRPFDTANPVRVGELIVAPDGQHSSGPDALTKNPAGQWCVRTLEGEVLLDECSVWSTEKRTTNASIRVRRWNSKLDPDIYQLVVERAVASKITDGVVILGNAKENSFPNPQEKFTIHIRTVPELTIPPDVYVPQLFGIDATGLGIINYAPEDRILVKSPEGVVVGHLHNNNNLYIHVDLMKEGSQREIRLLELILEESMKMRLRYAEQILIRAFSDQQAQVRTRIAQHETELVAAHEQLMSIYGALNKERMAYEYYDQYSAEQTLQFVRTHHMIDSFDSPGGSSLVIRTKEIYVEHPESGNIHNLGVFRIKLTMAPLRVTIMGEQTTMIANQKWYAPQMMMLEEGFIPLHNVPADMEKMMVELLSENRIANIIDLIIQWLEDIEAYYHNLTYWPVVS